MMDLEKSVSTYDISKSSVEEEVLTPLMQVVAIICVDDVAKSSLIMSFMMTRL